MSVADEIAKLDELRKNGTLSQAEFDEQKKAVLAGAAKPKRKWYKSWWLRAPVAIVALIILVNNLVKLSGGGELPGCGSSQAKAVVRNAIENMVTRPQVNLKLLDLTATKEVSYNKEKKERLCQGTAVLNTGEEAIKFRMWPSSNGMLLVEVQAK